jgi:hypothetical protein
MSSRKPVVKIGTTFHDSYADTRVEFKVIEALGPNVWSCEVITEGYEGGRRAYETTDIQSHIQMENHIAAIIDEGDAWWNSQELGSIVHYDNGFGAFVRGEIVAVGDTRREMMPIALVGKWAKSDLPRRYPTGETHYPYHARKIITRVPMQPNYTNMIEARGYRTTPQDPDTRHPSLREPIDLTLPEISDAEAIKMAKEVLRNRLKQALEIADADKAFEECRDILAVN